MHGTDLCIIHWMKKMFTDLEAQLIKKNQTWVIKIYLKKNKCCLTMINYKTNWNKIQKNVFVFYINLLIGLLQPNKKNGNMGKKLKLMTINHTRSLRYIFKCLDKKNQLFIYVEVNKQKN